jgi:hypothetical protein
MPGIILTTEVIKCSLLNLCLHSGFDMLFHGSQNYQAGGRENVGFVKKTGRIGRVSRAGCGRSSDQPEEVQSSARNRGSAADYGAQG